MRSKEICKNKKLEVPFDSWRKNKKKAVCVKDSSGEIKVVHFGDKRYEDYTQHQDKTRRQSFIARHKCSTAKDKTTARYWSCSKLWGKNEK